MPQFSVIVPTRNVQAYIRTCLDSILAQTMDDFEVIVIDDASTDDTLQIARGFEQRDDRVEVIALDVQLDGPGLLRNRALERSSGAWIVFVDSDDWIEPEMLETLATTVDRDDADLVVYDYDRVYWWGKRQRNAAGYIIQDLADRVVTAADHTQLFDLMPVAWNKAYRREFIDHVGIDFPRGIYEDQPWSYGLLAHAHKISVLDAVLYHYRQRRTGNLLRTESSAHFDVLEQWDRTMAAVASSPDADVLSTVVFDRMFDHALFVYGRGSGRLPRDERQRFFQAMSETYRRHVPSEVHEHPKISPVRSWLVANNEFWAYEALKRTNLLQRQFRSQFRRRRRAIARWKSRRKRAAVLWTYRNVFCRLPIDENAAVYAAYWNKQYACNPRAIYEAALRVAPEVRGMWSVAPKSAPSFPADVPMLLTGTWRWCRAMATSKYFINNVNFPDEIVKRPGQIHLQTQHGTPLKRMGVDMMDFPVTAGNQSFRGLLRRSDRWDYCLSSNRFSTEVWPRAYPCQFEVLNSGYPRNDILVDAPEGVAERVRSEYAIDPGKKVILYAPTLRDYKKSFSFPFDVTRLEQALHGEYVVLVRVHYLIGSNRALREATESGFLIDVSDYPGVEELYLASDILITDYSSVMFDFANLGRPIVIYADDWETYLLTRGTYFDLLAEPPGPVARNEDDLMRILQEKRYADEGSQRLLSDFRSRFCEFDDGRAAERVASFLFRDEAMECTDGSDR